MPPPEEAEGREGKNERWTQNFTIRTNVFSILALVKRRKLVTTTPISPFPTYIVQRQKIKQSRRKNRRFHDKQLKCFLPPPIYFVGFLLFFRFLFGGKWRRRGTCGRQLFPMTTPPLLPFSFSRSPPVAPN